MKTQIVSQNSKLHIIQGIGAVVAGFLTAVILSAGTDAVLVGIGYYPQSTNPGAYTFVMLFIGLAYRTAFTVLGGFVIGKLAPHQPMKYVMILAIIATLLGIGGIFAEWNMLAHWYPIAQTVLAFPSVWYGGKLATGLKKKS